jgi:hypothetical protein
MRPKMSRLAGRRLLALAKLLETPIAGRRLAALVMRDRLLGDLDQRDVSDAEMRPVISFRPAPRRPEA